MKNTMGDAEGKGGKGDKKRGAEDKKGEAEGERRYCACALPRVLIMWWCYIITMWWCFVTTN